jgi:hypothetical protein
MSNFSTWVSAWLPIRIPFFALEDRYNAYVVFRDKFLAQLPACLGITAPDVKDVVVSLNEAPVDVVRWLSSRGTLFHRRTVEYILVRALVTVDVDGLRQRNKGKEFDEELFRSMAAADLSYALQPILVMSELAEPGCIAVMEGLAIADGGGSYPILATGPVLNSWLIDECYSNWPPLDQLDVLAVMQWVYRTSFLKSCLGRTRVERTLTGYTHVIGLLGDYRDGEILFRSMQALEAFYCDGTGDLRKQLSDKSALWLGTWSDKSNIVGKLYDLRSKFIHGTATLEYWPAQGNSWGEDEKHMVQFERGVSFAFRLLLATLQKCVRENIVDVQWSYTVKTIG